MNRVVEYSRRDWYRQGAVKNQVSFSHFKRSRKIETPIVDPIDLNCRSFKNYNSFATQNLVPDDVLDVYTQFGPENGFEKTVTTELSFLVRSLVHT